MNWKPLSAQMHLWMGTNYIYWKQIELRRNLAHKYRDYIFARIGMLQGNLNQVFGF